MKMAGLMSILILTAAVVMTPAITAFAATDGFYTLSPTTTLWYGTDENRQGPPTDNYVSTYGDEASVTYTLPWSFTFYGQSFSQIAADTNGNIWFGTVGSANSFTLASNGRGPVIAAWNNDLSSYYSGGVFIQRKTNPDCVVVEWKTETYTSEGRRRPNSFETVLFPSGSIRVDYQSFTQATTNKDFGSGVSLNDGTFHVNLPSDVFTLGGQSFIVNATGGSTKALDVSFTGRGNVTSNVGVSWSGSNPAHFPTGTNIELQSTAGLGYIFSGWSGPCSGLGTCNFALSQDTTAAATYSEDTSVQRVLSSSGVHNHILQTAYDAALTGETLMLMATDFNESLLANQNKVITIAGGYNIDFTKNTAGITVLHGAITINNGKLIIKGLTTK
jgi:hypothetical protein